MKTNQQLADMFNFDVSEIEVRLTCKACGERKPEEAFQRQRARITGRQSYCRACRAEGHKRGHM